MAITAGERLHVVYERREERHGLRLELIHGLVEHLLLVWLHERGGRVALELEEQLRDEALDALGLLVVDLLLIKLRHEPRDSYLALLQEHSHACECEQLNSALFDSSWKKYKT